MVRQHPQVDPPRCALTAIHFPEHRTLTGDDTTAEPLPAVIRELAATAEAVTHCSGGHRPKTAKPADGNSAVRPAAATGSDSLHHGLPQRTANPERYSTAGVDAAVETGAAAVETKAAAVGTTSAAVETKGADAALEFVSYHAAGHDPVWLLLYAVKVIAQASNVWSASCLFSNAKGDLCRNNTTWRIPARHDLTDGNHGCIAPLSDLGPHLRVSNCHPATFQRSPFRECFMSIFTRIW